MSELALNVSVANTGKEYAIRKPAQEAAKPQEEAVALSQGLRESGIEWLQTKDSELVLSNRISESDLLLSTTTTDTATKALTTGITSQEMLQELKQRFKKLFISSYNNIFSHNRLLAKISEWMVGNVMERLALLGMSMEELDTLKHNVRMELVQKNQTAMAQVVYDETILEIVT